MELRHPSVKALAMILSAFEIRMHMGIFLSLRGVIVKCKCECGSSREWLLEPVAFL